MDTQESYTPDAATRERLLRVLALRPLGLFCDVDGTLSAIASTPETATLLPGVAEQLERARSVFALVAIVSGRSASDARRMVGIPGLLYIGNHGLDSLDEDDKTIHIQPEAEQWVRAINHVLATIQAPLMEQYPGLRFERKDVTASIHLRGLDDPQAVEGAIYIAVVEAASAKELRVTSGKLVIELRPPLEADKGVAIESFIRTRNLAGALYLGDDQTDIDAFRALRRLTAAGDCQGIAVAVLASEAPAQLAAEADMTLDSVETTPGFLQWLLDNVPAQ